MKGFILIYTLWIIGGVSVIISLISSKILFYNYYYNGYLNRLLSVYESKAVAVIALERSLRSMEANPGLLPLLEEPDTVSYAGREYKVYVSPEDAKLPIRFLGLNMIKRMLYTSGMKGKDADYYASKIAQGIQMEKYQHVGMLYWMLDEDYRLYLKIKDNVSFYTSRVNVNYASAEVLLSLGFTEKDIEKIMQYRKRGEFIDFFEFKSYLSDRWTEFEHIITLAPRPNLYRVKVKLVKPQEGQEVEYIISNDFSLIDRIQ